MAGNVLIIKPRAGLNYLNFGSSIEDAIRLFGKPDEQENMDTAGEYPSTVLHYWKQGFSLFFDHTHDKTFSCAEIDARTALLWDVKIFEWKPEQVIDLFRKKGFTASDSEKHEWGEKRVSFDEALIDFYFENDMMTSINFSAPPPEDDKKVLILPN